MQLCPTLRPYSVRAQLPRDVLAGLTVGCLAIPQSMSYALIAGLPVAHGLYSDLQVVYGLVGRSRHLVVGPVAVMSLLARGAVQGRAPDASPAYVALMAGLCLLVGVLQTLLGLAGVGARMVALMREPCLKAFTACAAITIASTQVPALIGCRVKADCAGVVGTWVFLLDTPNFVAMGVSVVTLLVLEGSRYLPGTTLSKMGSLLVMVLGIAFSYGVHPPGLYTVGFIPSGLPEPFAELSVENLAQVIYPNLLHLILSAIPIALVGFAEAFAIARVRKSNTLPVHATAAATNVHHHNHHQHEGDPATTMPGGGGGGGGPDNLNANHELVALGCANVWTSMLGGYPVTGSFSRSAVNAECGSTSAVSSFVAALLVCFTLLFFTSVLSHLPTPVVACVVLSAVLRLLDFHYAIQLMGRNPNAATSDKVVYASVFILGLAFGVEVGLGVGIFIGVVVEVVNNHGSGCCPRWVRGRGGGAGVGDVDSSDAIDMTPISASRERYGYRNDTAQVQMATITPFSAMGEELALEERSGVGGTMSKA